MPASLLLGKMRRAQVQEKKLALWKQTDIHRDRAQWSFSPGVRSPAPTTLPLPTLRREKGKFTSNNWRGREG